MSISAMFEADERIGFIGLGAMGNGMPALHVRCGVTCMLAQQGLTCT